MLIIDISKLPKNRIIKLKKYLLQKEGNVSVLLKKNNRLIVTAAKYNIDSNSRTKKEIKKALNKSQYKFL